MEVAQLVRPIRVSIIQQRLRTNITDAAGTACIGRDVAASWRNSTAERTMPPNLNCGEVSGQRIVRTSGINGENATGRAYADSIPAKCCASSTWNHVAKSEQYERQGEQHDKPKTRFHNAPPNLGIAERQPPLKQLLAKGAARGAERA